jgi:hypothetical protein
VIAEGSLRQAFYACIQPAKSIGQSIGDRIDCHPVIAGRFQHDQLSQGGNHFVLAAL